MTSNAAGTLEMEPRKITRTVNLVDLIVVDENPLEELSALEEIQVVVQGGEVVHGR